ncbi:hypothetical protein Pint_09667 [Pistacia integerrima]|uniref:Uncharacterized protein n=1 Tax=Pistacia integerrima TaxID=434235 RepID=A0ACC0XKP1_9ROSI|nr:hypothetical protein Pint_09667 [Pistacia integerrima]
MSNLARLTLGISGFRFLTGNAHKETIPDWINEIVKNKGGISYNDLTTEEVEQKHL